MTANRIEPVIKTLALDASVQKAFDHFTKNIFIWWPLAGHSLSQEDAETVVFEAKEGGRIYEVDKAGKEREWGRVLECDAPHRLVWSWVLEAPEKTTEIEVRFEEKGGDKCVLTLTHYGWENRPDGEEWRNNYNTGWDGVLAQYCESLVS